MEHKFRNRFIIPKRNDEEQIYFLGNSLGLQPVGTADAIKEVLDQWSYYGVEGFFEGDKPWLQFHGTLTGPLSKIVGGLPHEVVVMNQLTVNLHLLLASFYKPKGKRNKIICEAKAFPSDQYMLETHVRHYGFNPDETIIEVEPRHGEHTIRHEDILQKIEENKNELALVLWGGVNYYTGQLFDIKSITDTAHKAGAKAGFDLAHAAGNVELKLHDWNVDFAAWCSYKYLNSGPGSIAGAFIHERYHKDNDINRFAGWWGYNRATRFKMAKGFKPEGTAEGWQLSTPSILLYAAHRTSLQIFEEAGMEELAKKGRQLSDCMIDLLKDEQKLEIITPQSKGCQVSMIIKNNGRQLFHNLSAEGIFADWREPDVIRVAAVPLYNTFEEVRKFSQVIKKLLA
jgi:kynureninase